MKFRDFYDKFKDEKACKDYIRQIREQEGVVCKKCSGKSHYWKNDKEVWECKSCSFRTSLRSGTVMEGSKLPYSYWLAGMQFLTATKKSFSAKYIQEELGHKRYEPIWAMLHKLRMVMGHRDKLYRLTEYVEMDEGFFESADKKDKNDEGNKKRGRGSKRQVKVLVAAESKEVKDSKSDKKRSVRHLKMTVMNDLGSESINKQVEKDIDKKAVVMTDGWRGYNYLSEKVKEHVKLVVENPKEAGKVFPWVHTAISNSKRMFLGIYHRIDSPYMQNYLNEFCYKFNRRYFKDKVFDRLVVASVTNTWYGYHSG